MSEPTATRALRCFEELALVKGLDQVSMRDVAKQLGISLASLQYHYATKSALLGAVMGSTIDQHQRRLDEALEATEGTDRIVEALRYVAQANAAEADGGGMMAMIWARAAHDADAAAVVERFMAAYLERMMDVIASAAPGRTRGEELGAAALAIALLEGLEGVRPAAVAAGADSEALTSLAVTVAAALPDLVVAGNVAVDGSGSDLVPAENEPVDGSAAGRRRNTK
ncbi:MAG: TetR/AcrR family transcriptional regulator [Actinomycetota bacterium]